MDISFLGAGSVKLSGRNLNVVVDPAEGSSAKGDVVTKSRAERLGDVAGAMTLDRPGEYEVKGAMITGVPARLHLDEDGQRGTVFSITIDDVNVVVTGDIAGKLAESEVEALGNVDVLVVPVGGGGLTLDAEGAAEVVTQLEPHYVIPVHYDDGATTYEVPQSKVELFLKEMGASPEPQAKLKVNARELPAETEVVLLSRS